MQPTPNSSPLQPGQGPFLRKIAEGLPLDKVIGKKSMPNAALFDQWMADDNFRLQFQAAHKHGGTQIEPHPTETTAERRAITRAPRARQKEGPTRRMIISKTTNPKDGLQRLKYVGNADSTGKSMNFVSKIKVHPDDWDTDTRRVKASHPEAARLNDELDWYELCIQEAIDKGMSALQLRQLVDQPQERRSAIRQAQSELPTAVAPLVSASPETPAPVAAPIPVLANTGKHTIESAQVKGPDQVYFVVNGRRHDEKSSAVLHAFERSQETKEPVAIERHEVYLEGTFTPAL